MESLTTNLTNFSNEMTRVQDEILQFVGSVFDGEPILMQGVQQGITVPNLDQFETEVSQIVRTIQQYSPPTSELSEAMTQISNLWAHLVVIQRAGTNPAFPLTLMRISYVERRRTLSEPTPRRRTFFQSRETPTGSLRSPPFRGTWSSFSTLAEIQSTNHFEADDPNWLSEILTEPAASMFDDEDSTVADHDVGENHL